ncbi:MAG TPA: DUF120 domain-containing protein [Nitrososphaerales archaeon]|nr:DUF120 domain-containing protein [Nitrososphaerales archaeon]
MQMLKPSHIPTIIELISLGAKDRPVAVTTVSLARKLGKSQQLASKHLDEMEQEGLLERMRSGGKTYIRLTKKGVSAAAALYKPLQIAFEEMERVMELHGKVFSGLGEGAYYVSMNGYRRQFISKLGFDPFPGTLNVRLLSAVDRKMRKELGVAKGIHIEGFDDGKRTYGGAECFKAVVNGEVKAAVLVLERTSHDDTVMELISPLNVRETLDLSEGDRIDVKVVLEASSELPSSTSSSD